MIDAVVLPCIARRCIIDSMHMDNFFSTDRNSMVHIGGLKEGENMIKVFRVTHSHWFPMTETPEPESQRSQVVAQENTFFGAIVMRSIAYMRMLSWKVTRDVRAENMPVAFEIVAQGVRPKGVKLLPGGFTIRIWPVGVRAKPMEEHVGPEASW
jgi:hypothetical protein